MLRIEPVPPGDRDRALHLLVGDAARAAAFAAMLDGPDHGRCLFWWARGLGGPRAAAMTVRNAGRTAMVFHTPADSCRTEVLARLLEELTEATIATDVVFVQGLLNPDDGRAIEAFVRAGYRRVAPLIYLRRALSGGGAVPDGLALTWPTYDPSARGLLAEVIADTYVDSSDCPALLGLRTMDEVIDAHIASGICRHDLWLLPADAEGRCVGCVLVNQVAGQPQAADVVYLGVRPPWRGRGVGRAMLRQAARRAAGAGMRTMYLAVDAENAPAVSLYAGEGFLEIDRKDVYVRPGPGAAGGADAGKALVHNRWTK